MNPTQVFAISLLLLLISTGIESYRIQKRESPTYVSQAQELLTSAWEQVSSKVQEAIGKVRSTGMEEKAKEYYVKATSAVTPYSNVLYDQMYHFWYGN